jgi:ABC-type branched-subunit amino acid transport system substrate-binding protein
VLGATTVAALAACGSQVPPAQFFNGQGLAQVDAQGVDGAGTVATDPAAADTLAPNGAATTTSAAPGSVPNGEAPARGGGDGDGEVPAAGDGGAPVAAGGHGRSSGGGKSASNSAPGSSAKAGSCAGFTNTTGITDSQITIANVADISGPVPNLFKSAQSAVAAYVAYFNSTSSICGRKLRLLPLDSGTSENIDQQADTTACSSAFAEVGSLGAFDAGGASVAAKCGIPDLRAFSTEPDRFKSPVSYGAYSLAINLVPSAPFSYFKTLGDAYQHAAFVYLNAGAAIVNAKSYMAAEEKLGFDYKDQVPIDVTSVPNYGAIVQRLKGDGIKYVQYMGAYQYAVQLKSAMYQQDYNPVFVMDPTGYDADYVAAGKSVDGTYSFVPAPLFEEAGKNPELQTYLTWLTRTSGGTPTFFGVYAWAAADMFTQLAMRLGGKLTRASLLQAVRGVRNFTDNGMVPPQNPGIKQTGKCLSVVQLVNGKWVRKTPYPYTCGSLIDSGVGG